MADYVPMIISPEARRFLDQQREIAAPANKARIDALIAPIIAADLSKPRRSHLGCAICDSWPADRQQALHDDLLADDPDLLGIALKHRISPRRLLKHVACLGPTSITTEDVQDLLASFGNEVFASLRRSIMRAELILSELFDTTRVDPETGAVIYPYRTADLADSFARLAKVQSATLTGIVARADRQRLAEQLADLEERLSAARAAPPPAPPERPRRSLAHLLTKMHVEPQYLTPDPGADTPDPFR